MDKGVKASVVAAVVCLGAASASGQEVLTAIGGTATNPIGSALRDLDIDFESGIGAEDFLVKLHSQEWDLVVVHLANRFLPAFEADILVELQAHVDGGGALHFQLADLENVLDGWYDLLGLEGAVDLELPLSDIRTSTPRHPSVVTGGIGLSNERYPPDYGDRLIPSVGSFVVAFYEADLHASTIIGCDGLVLVNGQQWDNWAGGTRMARDQLSWLLSCKADLDGDGDLTVFDFFAFQNAFDAGDPAADVFYDGRLDIFDFLAFVNVFENGC